MENGVVLENNVPFSLAHVRLMSFSLSIKSNKCNEGLTWYLCWNWRGPWNPYGRKSCWGYSFQLARDPVSCHGCPYEGPLPDQGDHTLNWTSSFSLRKSFVSLSISVAIFRSFKYILYDFPLSSSLSTWQFVISTIKLAAPGCPYRLLAFFGLLRTRVRFCSLPFILGAFQKVQVQAKW